MSHVEKLDLRFLQNKTEIFLVLVTHLILRFTNVQNKFQQTDKTKINHINDNHIKFDVSLHFGGIWPTVGHRGDGELMFNSIIVLLASLTMSVLSLQCAPIEVRARLRGAAAPWPGSTAWK